MYRLLIKRIRGDNSIPQEKKSERIVNVMDFWIKNGKKFNRVLKNLKTKNEKSIKYFCRYIGFWKKFKLLYEGKEINLENCFPLDLEELNNFMISTISLAAH